MVPAIPQRRRRSRRRSSGRSTPKARRLPLAFSTLGCPQWDWKTILRNASQMGYSALELRGILAEMNLPKVPEFMGDRLKTSLRDLAALGLQVSDLGASAMLHEPDAMKRAKQMEEAKRFIDLAYRMKVPYVRVFPNQFVPEETRQVTIERIAAGLRELADYCRGSGVSIIVESHGDFVTSPDLLELMQKTGSNRVALLWDAHHTCAAGEKPDFTWHKLGQYVRHTHLKDSVPADKGRRYVLTGEGQIPVQETVQALVAGGYKGYYCFEWEKRWHPELAEPEVAFPHYAKVMKEYLAAAEVK